MILHFRCIYTFMNDADFRDCKDCFCFAARRAARSITQYYDQQLRDSGLRTTQFTLLNYLILAGRCPVNVAAEYLGLERTTLTRNLQPLLALEYVSVESADDRRVKLIAITARGRAAAVAALPLWRKAQRAMSRHLDPSAFKELAAAAVAA